MKAIPALPFKLLCLFSFALLVAGCERDAPAPAADAPSRPSLFMSLSGPEQETLQNCGVGPQELDRYLLLPQEQFDQDFEDGWRKVSEREECREAASALIQAYLRYSVRPVEDLEILRWHAGQLEAMSGNAMEAIALFRGTYRESADPSDVAWRLYARATIAFLQRDRKILSALRDELAALPVPEEETAARLQFQEDNPDVSMPEGFVEEPENLTVLDRLLRCFDSDYASAYNGDC
ncbi:MAG: hypothetical protein P8008_06950 [Gammaproteobacteria bacterium]